MVEHITERFRHHTLGENLQQQQTTIQCGLYRGSGRPDSWSPVITTTYPSPLARGRSLEESTPPNVFSIRQSSTPPSRALDTPPFSPRPHCPHCEREWAANYPPNKRHCRSLSIPNTRGVCPHLAANLYRPVAVRPGSASKCKNRNSPLHYTTRSHGNLHWHHQGVTSPGVHRSSSEFSSPPDSPIPRPASVSSGYYDSSMSSLAGLPWLDHYSPNIFQKSLSMEEPISGPVGVYARTPPTSFSPPTGGGKRERIPRCRSQPCVLTKSGVKRRREDLLARPTVDFLKMKETAYHHFRRPRAYSASHPKEIRAQRSREAYLAEEEDKVFGLNPILGSPLDSHIAPGPPKMSQIAVSPSTSPTQEVDEEVEGINFSKLQSASADSGCSADGEDPPHLVEYPEMGDYSPCPRGAADPPATGRQPGTHIDSVFPLDELDLEQIEND